MKRSKPKVNIGDALYDLAIVESIMISELNELKTYYVGRHRYTERGISNGLASAAQTLYLRSLALSLPHG